MYVPTDALSFTALFERKPDGTYTASVEEMPDLVVSGHSFEQARQRLVALLQWQHAVTRISFTLSIRFRYIFQPVSAPSRLPHVA